MLGLNQNDLAKLDLNNPQDKKEENTKPQIEKIKKIDGNLANLVEKLLKHDP